MKRTLLFSLTLALTVLGTWPAQTIAQAGEMRGFARLRSLAGEWEGRTDKGEGIQARFQLVASDSALLEMDTFPDGSTEATVYYADMNRVALTRFDKANNQPRMSADPSVGGPTQLDFSFVGASNLHNLQIGHMNHLILRFEDSNHFTAVWTWLHNDQEQDETYHFVRKR